MLENINDDKLDHGLIGPISIPQDNRVPDSNVTVAMSWEYDSYFRLRRERISLVEWTRTCLTVNREIVQDLDDTGLGAIDKQQILTGLTTVMDITLSRWLGAHEQTQEKAH